MSGIFISYRRDDTGGYAGRLYDALTAEFDKRLVFIDVDSIRAGQDFVEVIDERIASSSVVIVLIGKGWLNSGGANGRRLDDPHDFVRLEVASTLRQKIAVVPVLVGGAKMPAASDLPELLAPLAHINAIEIFDQLFRDSVKHLVEELRPFVHHQSRFQFFFRGWTRRGFGGLVLFFILLLASIEFGIIVSRFKQRAASNFSQQVVDPAIAPDSTETLAGFEADTAPPVKVTTPPEISELPPVVETSRDVTLPGSSTVVTGPSKPQIVWRADVTVGDEWNIVGVASDGTVYIYDTERSVVAGLRDGKELWAHPSPSPLGFDAEGRLWLTGVSSVRVGDDFFNFNSLGEGGRVSQKSLYPDPLKLQLSPFSRESNYSCRDGKVSKQVQGKHRWMVNTEWIVDLDGNCGSPDPVVAPQTGNVFVWSDAGTLYSITSSGQVLWNVKRACKDSYHKAYPMLNDDLVIACRHEPLHALRGGRPLWTADLGVSSDWTWEDIISDAAGNIYAGGEPLRPGKVDSGYLIALDKAGKRRWIVSAGSIENAQPAGFDAQGRLYVTVRGQHLVALSQ